MKNFLKIFLLTLLIFSLHAEKVFAQAEEPFYLKEALARLKKMKLFFATKDFLSTITVRKNLFDRAKL